MIKKVFVFFLPCILASLCLAPLYADDKKCDIAGTTKNAPTVCGVAVQGGMIYGQTDGWTVYVNDTTKISRDGVFVIGLDRDAADTLKLKFCISGKSVGVSVCETYSYPIAKRTYIEQKVSVADKYNKYPIEIEERINRENKKISSVRRESLKDSSLYFMNLAMPDNLKKFNISGVYGSRRVFNGVPKSPHKGLDFAAPAGTPVYPIADGVVILAEEHYMNGNIIMVSHGHGVVSAYLHLDKINTNVGDTVDMKTKIGTVGSTGRSSGAHLHMGLYQGQIAIDPGLFILPTQKVR